MGFVPDRWMPYASLAGCLASVQFCQPLLLFHPFQPKFTRTSQSITAGRRNSSEAVTQLSLPYPETSAWRRVLDETVPGAGPVHCTDEQARRDVPDLVREGRRVPCRPPLAVLTSGTCPAHGRARRSCRSRRTAVPLFVVLATVHRSGDCSATVRRHVSSLLAVRGPALTGIRDMGLQVQEQDYTARPHWPPLPDRTGKCVRTALHCAPGQDGGQGWASAGVAGHGQRRGGTPAGDPPRRRTYVHACPGQAPTSLVFFFY
jgi:hypothetical protein